MRSVEAGLKRLLSPLGGRTKRSRPQDLAMNRLNFEETPEDEAMELDAPAATALVVKKKTAEPELHLSEARDLVIRIFSFFVTPEAVDYESLTAISQTCRLWREWRSSPYLWRDARMELSDGSMNWSLVERLQKHHDGTEGLCVKCRLRSTGELLAARKPRVYFKADGEGIPYYMMRELAVLRMLTDTRIATPTHVHLKEQALYVFFPFAEMDLIKLMTSLEPELDEQDPTAHRARRIDEAHARPLLKQLLLAVAHCHARGVIHRNIKPNHLLIQVGPDPKQPFVGAKLKLADFALTRITSVPVRPYTPSLMTLWYKPPEMLLGQAKYTTGVDMWSVGCVYAQMLSGVAPFPGCSEIDQLFRVFNILGTPTEETWPAFPGLPGNDVDFPNWDKRCIPKLFTRLDIRVKRSGLRPLDLNVDAPGAGKRSVRRSPRVPGGGLKAVERPDAFVSEAAIRFLDTLWQYDDAERHSAVQALSSAYLDAAQEVSLAVLETPAWDPLDAMTRFYDARLADEASAVSLLPDLPEELVAADERTRVAEWVLDVVDNFEMSTRGFFLSMRYFDDYLSLCPEMPAAEWELLAATCLHVASKCEDVHYIGIRDLISCARNAFTWEDVLRVESLLLKALDFRLAPPVLLDFVQLSLGLCGVGEGRVRSMAYYLAEVAGTTPEASRELPSKVAAAILVLSHLYCEEVHWTATIARVVHHAPPSLDPVARKLHEAVLEFRRPIVEPVRRRHAGFQQHHVAGMILPTGLALQWHAPPAN